LVSQVSISPRDGVNQWPRQGDNAEDVFEELLPK
jgi:hypothetical protein